MIGLFLLILGIMFGPSVIFAIIGISKRKSKPELAKVFFILAVVYVLISGGICASIITDLS